MLEKITAAVTADVAVYHCLEGEVRCAVDETHPDYVCCVDPGRLTYLVVCVRVAPEGTTVVLEGFTAGIDVTACRYEFDAEQIREFLTDHDQCYEDWCDRGEGPDWWTARESMLAELVLAGGEIVNGTDLVGD